MKIYRAAIMALAAAMAASFSTSCNTASQVEGVLADTAGNPVADAVVVAKKSIASEMEILDSLRTDAEGRFNFSLDVQENQPEFVHLYSAGKKIASLVLQHGDVIDLKADGQGGWTVEGSEESAKLCLIEKRFKEFTGEYLGVEKLIIDAAEEQEAVAALYKLDSLYKAYNKECVKYMVSNIKSLATISLIQQSIDGRWPVFNRPEDAYVLKVLHDSLATVYPESKYVKALARDVDKRLNIIGLQSKIDEAQQAGIIDFTMPDTDGNQVKLSDVVASSKVVLLHFWTSTDANARQFNIETLKPLYEEYHSKGFDICQVSLDTDKTAWALTVRRQELPWTNICDGKGPESPVVLKYQLAKLPAAYLIVDGDIIIPDNVSDDASFRAELSKYLN